MRAGHVVVDWAVVVSGPVELEVSADALRIGASESAVRMPMSAATQQQVADLLHCVLPTPKVSDLIWQQAVVRLTPHAQDVVDMTPAAYLAQDKAVGAELAGRTGLVACVGKDWALAKAALADPTHAANYGWHVATAAEVLKYGATSEAARRAVSWAPDLKAWVVQPLATRHTLDHEDYSQKCRLVRRVCRVQGVPTTVEAVLADPGLAPFISHEGVLAGTRLPGVAKPSASDVPPPNANAVVVLRRGDVGEHVKDWQRIVGVAPDAAGTFGPKTEAATKAWQRAHGHPETGVVTAEQLALGRIRSAAPVPDAAPRFAQDVGEGQACGTGPVRGSGRGVCGGGEAQASLRRTTPGPTAGTPARCSGGHRA